MIDLLSIIALLVIINFSGLYLGYKSAKASGLKFYKAPSFYILVISGWIPTLLIFWLNLHSNIPFFEHDIFGALGLFAFFCTPIFIYRSNKNYPKSKLNFASEWVEWSFVVIFSICFLLMVNDLFPAFIRFILTKN